MSKTFVAGFLVGIALLIGAGLAGSPPKQKDLGDKYEVEVIDATPVQLGVLTEQQRIHSQLYQSYSELFPKKMSEITADPKAKGTVALFVISVALVDYREPEAPEQYFGKLAHESDTVIRGKVTKKTAQVTEGQTFIFTDYDILVTDVLKDNAAAPIHSGATITVTRPGGKILINGVVVKIRDDSCEALPANHSEVLLFLKYIPESGTYKATECTGCFEVTDSSVRPLTGLPFPAGVLDQDRNSFLRMVKTVSAQ